MSLMIRSFVIPRTTQPRGGPAVFFGMALLKEQGA